MKTLKRRFTDRSQFKEIIWNVVNSGLVGAIFLTGAMSNGGSLSWESLFFATAAAITAALIQFKNYWDNEKAEYSTRLLKIF